MGVGAEALPGEGIKQKFREDRTEDVGPFGRNENPGVVVADCIRYPIDGCRHHGTTTGHALKADER